MTQTALSRSISSQRAQSTSPERQAVRMANSKRPGGHRLPGTELRHEIRKLLVGQRRVMAACERLGLRKQVLEVATPARGVFTRPEAANRGCIKDLLNAAPKTLGGLGQSLPDRLQHLQHRLGVDLIDRNGADLARNRW